MTPELIETTPSLADTAEIIMGYNVRHFGGHNLLQDDRTLVSKCPE